MIVKTRPEHCDPASARGFGVTCCTSCGQPVETVGPLRPDGCCSVCGHDLDGHDILAAELRRFIQPWLAACKERDISRQMMASAWDQLDGEMFPFSEGVSA